MLAEQPKILNGLLSVTNLGLDRLAASSFPGQIVSDIWLIVHLMFEPRDTTTEVELFISMKGPGGTISEPLRFTAPAERGAGLPSEWRSWGYCCLTMKDLKVYQPGEYQLLVNSLGTSAAVDVQVVEAGEGDWAMPT
jgi:hypothetical protein